ncbi:outer membrane protein assembly factor BamB [Formivibrio citricus]|uniref:Outer membrane protein assembly factor BamB n=1 Tax=Formivibrio citricus TaxID=83765 RepID=A0A1I4XAS9_9NEIS|nr:outer membrane protein assembly factor BamB [Formivibrio citricus]SFN23041.1 outer membrane protein assembly factor BamB [Formivibrio citricus]
MKTSSLFAGALLAALLAGCGPKSNVPVPSPLPVVQNKFTLTEAWRQSLGSAASARLQPALFGELVAVQNGEKKVSLLNLATGAERWSATLPNPAAGGVGLGEKLLVAGTVKGEVLAFDLQGKQVWQARTSSEIMAPPVIAGGLVLVRSGDGRLTAFAAADGALKWTYSRQQPALVLRNFAAPVVVGDLVYYGQAGGKLVVLSLREGRVLWEAAVAQPRGASEVERVADVVAAPVVDGSMVCAVAYQGRLSCFNTQSGSLVWSREVSSWNGLFMDNKAVYVTDDKGYVVAYERSSGRNLWRQEKLYGRGVSGPAVIGRNLMVGDQAGYLHVLNTEDGSFVARHATRGAVVAAPQVVNGQWLVQTQKGVISLLGTK